MKSKLVVLMVAGAFLVVFAEASLVWAELWINPLFEPCGPAAKMSLVTTTVLASPGSAASSTSRIPT